LSGEVEQVSCTGLSPAIVAQYTGTPALVSSTIVAPTPALNDGLTRTIITNGSVSEADTDSLHDAPGHDAGAGIATGAEPDAGGLADCDVDGVPAPVGVADGAGDDGPDEAAPIAEPVPRVVVEHAVRRPTSSNVDPTHAVARSPLIARCSLRYSIDRTDPALPREDGPDRT
jgi:hypothetical protein